jgi:hypothetical protein
MGSTFEEALLKKQLPASSGLWRMNRLIHYNRDKTSARPCLLESNEDRKTATLLNQDIIHFELQELEMNRVVDTGRHKQKGNGYDS